MDYNTGYQYSVTGSGVEPTSGILSPTTGDVNVTIEGVNSRWTGVTATPQFKQTTPGAAFQFTQTVAGPGLSNQTIIQGDHRYKRNGHYKYLPAIIALLFAAPVRAETVGGVSATASPIANSSGSVTNQAIQVLQGPYITNTYGEEYSARVLLSILPHSLQVHFLNNIHMKTSIWIPYMICVT